MLEDDATLGKAWLTVGPDGFAIEYEPVNAQMDQRTAAKVTT